jgi:hypothetical protein
MYGVGGLIGKNEGQITGCHAAVSVSNSYGDVVGGLVGYNVGLIDNCYATGSVSGDYYSDYVGGLVGSSEGYISESYATGSVLGDYRIGGLVGINSGHIMNCYAKGRVLALTIDSDYLGGLVGSNSGTITNAFSTGLVLEGTYSDWFGGLVGRNTGRVTYSYWDVTTSRQSASAGGEGKTGAEMKDISTYWHWATQPAVWTIDDGNDRAHLAWEQAQGKPIDSPRLSDFLTGSGLLEAPFFIESANDFGSFVSFSCEWDKHYRLTADINVSYLGAADCNVVGLFSGVFDGGGHMVSGFSCRTASGLTGLFGCVYEGDAQIRDLGLIEPDVNAVGLAECVGSLVGWLDGGTISGCWAQAGKVSGRDYTGGLVGRSDQGHITSCHTTTTVSGDGDWVGGLIGHNGGYLANSHAAAAVSGNDQIGGLTGENEGLIVRCYATDNVSGRYFVGGLVGRNNEANIVTCYSSADVFGDKRLGGLIGSTIGTVENSYATGNVSGGNYPGGLVGTSVESSITNCYSVGNVSTTYPYHGGLIANNVDSDVTNCFWDIETSGQTTSEGGVGKTTMEMQTKCAYTSAGWDFVGETVNGPNDIWRMCWDGGWYPRLTWQFYEWGDFVCPDRVDLKDFSYLAARWGQTDCAENNNCDGADLDLSEMVDRVDLLMFSDLWLRGRPAPGELAVPAGVNSADYANLAIRWLNQQCWLTHNCYAADLDFSGAVDWGDVKIFCDHWLEGIGP